MVAPRHRRSTAGQASVEYVAAVALAAAVLAAAGTAVAAPAIPAGVVHGIRHGICVVAGDVCTAAEARAAGLRPCTVASTTRGREGRLELFFVMAAAGSAYTATQDSEGRVTVVRSQMDKAGLQAGAALELGAFGVGADAGVDLRVNRATAWRFPNLAHARGFVDGLPDSARRPSPYEVWRSYDAGPEAEAEVSATVVGHTLAGVWTGVGAGGGARIGRDGTVTLYFKAQAQRPGPSGDLTWGAGGNATNLLGELTFARGEPRELALHRVQSSSGGKRLVETVGRLDLRDPANLAAAVSVLGRKAPWPPAIVAGLLRRIARAGTVERSTYTVRDRSRTVDVAVKLGEELGLQLAVTRTDGHLVGAEAWTRGSPERERFDCELRPR